ncbi:hypothetical protein [Vreelandella jeotgali]|uniref:hypothetical protein n=1 Tax=Vreelandella jeotgali TaxID=553386 RepID=UPI000349E6E9|nr:hypothetical protein [Halomonas jeotgali]
MLADNLESWVKREREEGRQEGEVKGEANLLKTMIVSKYGECPEWVQEKLNEADSEQLGAWGQRIFQASTLEGLLL